MAVANPTVTASISEFIARVQPPRAALERAAIAVCDTVGVILAGVSEPAAEIIRATAEGSRGPCRILGTSGNASATDAALANAVAAHALDYDDMCFVSLAHPSCALVPAVLAVGQLIGAPGATLLEAYVAGFEVE